MTKRKCWKQKLTAPGAMAYCPFERGHKGKHSWQLLPWEWLARLWSQR